MPEQVEEPQRFDFNPDGDQIDARLFENIIDSDSGESVQLSARHESFDLGSEEQN